MSVNDPLLKELKGHIFDLRRYSLSAEVTDNNASLLPFCETLEAILRRGLKSISSAFGRSKRDYWHWIENLNSEKDHGKLSSTICDLINMVKENKKVHHSQGKGRLFLRIAMMKRVLHKTIEYFIRDTVNVQVVYEKDSILYDEILSEIFLSLIYEIDNVKFKLTLKNASFLDETWQLGVYKMYEFVPCKDLGISLGFVKGRPIVVNVEKGSVAAEDDQIEVGDMLDELYGKPLYGCRKGTISSLLNSFQGLPIYICIVKCLFWSGYVYPPLRQSLIQLHLNVRQIEEKFHHKLLKLAELQSKNLDPFNSQISKLTKNDFLEKESANSGYSVLFLGSENVGQDHGMVEIGKAINKFENSQNKKEVSFCIREIRIVATEKYTNNIIVSKHYTEISSCGRRTDSTKYFAFIAGETLCTVAKNFVCYVFEASTVEESKIILSHIAQGFGRTHWAV